jgi:hypothetical protein
MPGYQAIDFSTAGSGTGTPLRTGGLAIDAMLQEVYARPGTNMPLPGSGLYVPQAFSTAGQTISDGVTDAAPAINAAIAALGSNGGTIHLPPGIYACASPLNFDGKQGVTVQGLGAPNAGGAESHLLYTGTGSGSFISARSTTGFAMDNLEIRQNDPSMTGDLVDMGWSGASTDASLFLFNRIVFAGAGPTSSLRSMLLLDRAIIGRVSGCSFVNAPVGILGRSAAARYSNAIVVDGQCSFINIGVAPIKNIGQGWVIDACTFEPLSTGAAGGLEQEAAYGANGTKITGCWFGDANSSGSWIHWGGRGLVFDGNYIGNGAVGLDVWGGSFGVAFRGNDFNGQATGNLRFSGACTGVAGNGNSFTGTATPIVGGRATYSHTNYDVSANYGVNDEKGIVSAGLTGVTGTIPNGGTFTITGMPFRAFVYFSLIYNVDVNNGYVFGGYATDGVANGRVFQAGNVTAGGTAIGIAAGPGPGVMTVTNNSGSSGQFSWAWSQGTPPVP